MILKKTTPFYIFFGGGGVGKSHLIKTVRMALSKTWSTKVEIQKTKGFVPSSN